MSSHLEGESLYSRVIGRMGSDPAYDFTNLAWGVDLVEEHHAHVMLML